MLADVFVDNFDETNPGWIVNPNGTDTAITNVNGQWIIAPITEDRFNGNNALALQLNAFSSPNALITGYSDTDDEFTQVNGITTIKSPNFTIPSDSIGIDLSLQYYVIALNTIDQNDYVNIDLVDATDNTILASVFDQSPPASQAPIRGLLLKLLSIPRLQEKKLIYALRQQRLSIILS